MASPPRAGGRIIAAGDPRVHEAAIKLAQQLRRGLHENLSALATGLSVLLAPASAAAQDFRTSRSG